MTYGLKQSSIQSWYHHIDVSVTVKFYNRLLYIYILQGSINCWPEFNWQNFLNIGVIFKDNGHFLLKFWPTWESKSKKIKISSDNPKGATFSTGTVCLWPSWGLPPFQRHCVGDSRRALLPPKVPFSTMMCWRLAESRRRQSEPAICNSASVSLERWRKSPATTLSFFHFLCLVI